MRSEYWILLTITLTPFLIHMASCKPRETELPFDTIAQDDGLAWGQYEGREPKLLVLTGSEEIAVLDEVAPQAAVVEHEDSGKTQPYPEWLLQSIDWEAYFVVIAFQGLNKDGVTIERITQQGHRITIYARCKQLRPDEIKIDAVTSPLHVVKAEKNNQITGKELQFSLVVEGRTVANTSHIIP